MGCVCVKVTERGRERQTEDRQEKGEREGKVESEERVGNVRCASQHPAAHKTAPPSVENISELPGGP